MSHKMAQSQLPSLSAGIASMIEMLNYRQLTVWFADSARHIDPV